MSTTYKFLAQIGGGIGPDVWDKFLDIDADDITDAMNQAKGRAEDLGATVFSVEQNDFPRDIEKSYFTLQQELAALRTQRDALLKAMKAIHDSAANGNISNERNLHGIVHAAKAAIAAIEGGRRE